VLRRNAGRAKSRRRDRLAQGGGASVVAAPPCYGSERYGEAGEGGWRGNGRCEREIVGEQQHLLEILAALFTQLGDKEAVPVDDTDKRRTVGELTFA
jgi:hypothetical protein